MDEQTLANKNSKSKSKSPPSRRASEWDILDMSDEPNATAATAATADENPKDKQTQDQQRTANCAKITVRRKSERLLAKLKEPEEETNETGEPPLKRKRGRPTKVTNGNKTPSKTGTDTSTGASAGTAATADNSNSNNGFDFGIKAKCQLTKLILDVFDEFENDLNHENRYSARCTLCDLHQDRIKYVKGKNTNLKSHLERVIILLCLYFHQKKTFPGVIRYFDSIF